MIDTSVVIAAARSKKGASNALLIEIDRGRARMLLSVALFLEYEDVLKRADQRLAHGFSLGQVDQLLKGMADRGEPVSLSYSWRPLLGDANDEMVAEAAINGRAHAIVTHNAKDFEAVKAFGIKVWAPSRALKEVRK